MTYQLPPGAHTENWVDRNRRRLLPVAIVAGIVLSVGMLVAFVLLIFAVLRTSDPARMALERARSDPRARERLGSPIETGWWVSGSLNTRNTSGNATITIPVVGPHASGRLHLQARKEAGEWRLLRLVLQMTDTGELLDLLSAAPENRAGVASAPLTTRPPPQSLVLQ